MRISEYAQSKSTLAAVSQPSSQQGVNNGMAEASASPASDGHGQSGSAVASYADIEHSALTPDEERLIFEAAGRRLVAEVLGQLPQPLEQSLAGLASMSVAGAFVTLKRAGMLRSCCGSLGKATPLSKAIEHAAVAVAKHDRRFPPISPVELPYLDVDVWLLGISEPVSAKGPERRNAVIIGKHGLGIAKGNRHGLLLPGVAVEHHLDAEGFLEQVCHKAGLPADAWQDDDAALSTFEGRAIEGVLKTLIDICPPPFVASDGMGAGSGVRA